MECARALTSPIVGWQCSNFKRVMEYLAQADEALRSGSPSIPEFWLGLHCFADKRFSRETTSVCVCVCVCNTFYCVLFVVSLVFCCFLFVLVFSFFSLFLGWGGGGGGGWCPNRDSNPQTPRSRVQCLDHLATPPPPTCGVRVLHGGFFRCCESWGLLSGSTLLPLEDISPFRELCR